MKKYIIARHLVDGKDTFKEFKDGIKKLNTLVDISQTYDYGFEFGLNLTIDKRTVNESLQELIKKENLLTNLWFFYNPRKTGSGSAYKQILFNPAFLDKPSIVICACLDQYVIDSEDSLKQLEELAQKVEKDGALYATGSRDIPINLAIHEKNSELRIIHELFNSLTIGSNKLKVEEKRENVTPAYAEIGESTSGLDLINFSHKMYPELTKSIFRASQIANMNDFAADYYTSIKVSQLGELVNGYVISNKNKFYTKLNEKEEFKYVKNIIVEQTKELGKTDIKDLLLNTLSQKKNTERISEFYNRNNVEFVRDLMINAIISTN